MDVELDEIEYLLVAHLGEKHFGAINDFTSEQRLFGEHRINFLLDGSTTYKLMYQDVSLLSNPERTISSLVFDGGDSTTAGQKWMTWEAATRLSPVPPALSDKTKNGGPSLRLKLSTRRCRCATAVPPWSTRPGRPKTLSRN